MLRKFFAPFFKFSAPFWGVLMVGAFFLHNGGNLGASILTNPYAWTWFLGVISGYIVLDLTRKNPEHSFLLTWWENRGNPLSFNMVQRTFGTAGDDDHYSIVGAEVFNSAPLKRKGVCIIARDARACLGQERTTIEYCVNVPSQTSVFVPMFQISRFDGVTQYKVDPANLRSNHVSTEFCKMEDSGFTFKPCFSDDMNQEKCLRECTVLRENIVGRDITLVEEYYSENEETTLSIT